MWEMCPTKNPDWFGFSNVIGSVIPTDFLHFSLYGCNIRDKFPMLVMLLSCSLQMETIHSYLDIATIFLKEDQQAEGGVL